MNNNYNSQKIFFLQKVKTNKAISIYNQNIQKDSVCNPLNNLNKSSVMKKKLSDFITTSNIRKRKFINSDQHIKDTQEQSQENKIEQNADINEINHNNSLFISKTIKIKYENQNNLLIRKTNAIFIKKQVLLIQKKIKLFIFCIKRLRKLVKLEKILYKKLLSISFSFLKNIIPNKDMKIILNSALIYKLTLLIYQKRKQFFSYFITIVFSKKYKLLISNELVFQIININNNFDVSTINNDNVNDNNISLITTNININQSIYYANRINIIKNKLLVIIKQLYLTQSSLITSYSINDFLTISLYLLKRFIYSINKNKKIFYFINKKLKSFMKIREIYNISFNVINCKMISLKYLVRLVKNSSLFKTIKIKHRLKLKENKFLYDDYHSLVSNPTIDSYSSFDKYENKNLSYLLVLLNCKNNYYDLKSTFNKLKIFNLKNKYLIRLIMIINNQIEQLKLYSTYLIKVFGNKVNYKKRREFKELQYKGAVLISYILNKRNKVRDSFTNKQKEVARFKYILNHSFNDFLTIKERQLYKLVNAMKAYLYNKFVSYLFLKLKLFLKFKACILNLQVFIYKENKKIKISFLQNFKKKYLFIKLWKTQLEISNFNNFYTSIKNKKITINQVFTKKIRLSENSVNTIINNCKNILNLKISKFKFDIIPNKLERKIMINRLYLDYYPFKFQKFHKVNEVSKLAIRYKNLIVSLFTKYIKIKKLKYLIRKIQFKTNSTNKILLSKAFNAYLQFKEVSYLKSRVNIISEYYLKNFLMIKKGIIKILKKDLKQIFDLYYIKKAIKPYFIEFVLSIKINILESKINILMLKRFYLFLSLNKDKYTSKLKKLFCKRIIMYNCKSFLHFTNLFICNYKFEYMKRILLCLFIKSSFNKINFSIKTIKSYETILSYYRIKLYSYKFTYFFKWKELSEAN